MEKHDYGRECRSGRIDFYPHVIDELVKDHGIEYAKAFILHHILDCLEIYLNDLSTYSSTGSGLCGAFHKVKDGHEVFNNNLRVALKQGEKQLIYEELCQFIGELSSKFR